MPKAREVNDVIRYTMWSVFRVATPLGEATAPSWPPS
jgi:chlorite dismutase